VEGEDQSQGGGEGGREEGGRGMKRVSTVVGLSREGHTVEGGRAVRLVDHTGGREGGRAMVDFGRYMDERARGQLAQNLW